MPRIGPDPHFDEKVDRLLDEYVKAKSRHQSRRRLIISTLAALAFAGGIYETLTFGTTRVVATETALIGGSLLLCMALGYSIFLFWLGWNYGDFALKRGFTPVQAKHLGLILFLSAFSALPFASMLLSENRTIWGAVLTLFTLFWINASALITGYGGRIYSETKRLL